MSLNVVELFFPDSVVLAVKSVVIIKTCLVWPPVPETVHISPAERHP